MSTRLGVELLVGFRPVLEEEGHGLLVDLVHGDAQLPRQNRKRVAIDARQDAAAQVCYGRRTRPRVLQALRISDIRASE